MRPLEFHTEWEVPASVRGVWQVFLDPEKFAKEWSDVQSISVHGGPPLRRGSEVDWVIRSPMGLRLRFTTLVREMDEFRRIALDSRGDLIGTGRMDLEALPGRDGRPRCRLRTDWSATPRPALMVVIGALPGGRGVLSWGHNRVVAHMRKRLDAMLATPG